MDETKKIVFGVQIKQTKWRVRVEWVEPESEGRDKGVGEKDKGEEA